MSRRLGGLVAALAVACQPAFAPDGATRIIPPPAYRQWWEESRPCVHQPEIRRYEQIRWYVTPDMPVTSDGTPVWALTVGDHVYLWSAIDRMDWVIQHELVHAINGIRGHPADPFTRCRLMPSQRV